MESAKILLLCVLAACSYGILHDQITVRVCPEYFTVGHVNPFPTDSPTLLGLCWGVYATWWAGLLLGWLLIFAARVGKRVPRRTITLVKPVIFLLVVMGIFATLAGVVGAMLAKSGALVLPQDLAEKLPKSKHTAFLACAMAHTASYYVGFIGGGIQIAVVYSTRRKLKA
jgi:energy-coupling factor transporter transmembrane protein EcfT